MVGGRTRVMKKSLEESFLWTYVIARARRESTTWRTRRSFDAGEKTIDRILIYCSTVLECFDGDAAFYFRVEHFATILSFFCVRNTL